MATSTAPPENPPEWTAVDVWTTEELHTSAQSSSSAGPNPSAGTNYSPPPSPEVLAQIQANAARAGLPDIAVSAPQGAFLRLQARLLRARSVLEVGTLAGFSTAWLASSAADARVVSLEVDAHHAAVARANLDLAGYAAPRAEVRVGAALDAFPALASEIRDQPAAAASRPPFDLVFVDADKQNGWNYVDRAARLCRPGALIVVDNVVRRGRLASATAAAEDDRVAGSRLVVENVGKDPERFEACVLQTVGDKGYDGFLLIYVK